MSPPSVKAEWSCLQELFFQSHRNILFSFLHRDVRYSLQGYDIYVG